MARLEQQREHVIAAAAVAAALIDQGVDQLIGLRAGALEGHHRPAAGEQALRGGKQRQRAVAQREDLGQQLAQRLELRPALEAEDGAQDDLERHPL